MVLNVHYLTDTLNASALQQFCYCLFKVNKQKNTFKKARLFCSCDGRGFGQLQHALLLLRDITQHQSAVTRRVAGKALKDKKKGGVGGGRLGRTEQNATHAS